MTSGQRSTVEEASRHESELNQRQRHVLELIVRGRTNPEIATELGITLDGAKWHVSEILTKLGFSRREQAAEYWRQRNRPGTRLRRAFRGLLSIPVLKVAVGTGVAGSVVGIAIAAWLLFAGGSGKGLAPRVPPFELEARIVVTGASGAIGATTTGSSPSPNLPDETTSTIRWWFRDASHFRWDVERADGLDSTTIVMAADGSTQTIYDSSANTVSRGPYQPLPGGYVMPPAMSALLGPLPADNLTVFLDGWRRTEGTPKTAEIVGEEVILGRKTTIVEMGPTHTSTDSSGNETSSGTSRVSIDPERMFAMRMAADDPGNQSYLLEVTSLRYDLRVADVPVAFIPPPGATQGTSASISSYGAGSAFGTSSGSSSTLAVKSGFLLPAYVPPGYAASSEGQEGGPGGGTVAVENLLVAGGSSPPPYLRIQQRKRSDGLPAVLRTGTPNRINGHDAYRGTNGSAKTLAWEQDGVSVLLTSDTLPYTELEQVAASMSLQK